MFVTSPHFNVCLKTGSSSELRPWKLAKRVEVDALDSFGDELDNELAYVLTNSPCNAGCHGQGLRTRATAKVRNCDIDTLETILAKADLPSCGVDDMLGRVSMSRRGNWGADSEA